MKLQELVHLMQKLNRPLTLTMFDDGSGEVKDENDNIVFDFETYQELETKMRNMR